MLLDEWQEVPEVLAAAKRAVDRGAEAGSFILTGSGRAALTSASWPGTGRLITMDMHPLTVLEQRASNAPHSDIIARVMSNQVSDLALPPELPNLVEYLDLAMIGGYPPVVRLPARSRRLWLKVFRFAQQNSAASRHAVRR
ncbi:AAA family ATPase [Amycolatopsis alkalitolerans]|uniref:AAA family ATPase n=1 Tax=Amycolatopsis alkalitolerans TaxID=2547244 RepID=UPI001F33AD5C|nr:AAA family ATPase [Amycolatopsis alkalitolerans]